MQLSGPFLNLSHQFARRGQPCRETPPARIRCEPSRAHCGPQCEAMGALLTGEPACLGIGPGSLRHRRRIYAEREVPDRAPDLGGPVVQADTLKTGLCDGNFGQRGGPVRPLRPRPRQQGNGTPRNRPRCSPGVRLRGPRQQALRPVWRHPASPWPSHGRSGNACGSGCNRALPQD